MNKLVPFSRFIKNNDKTRILANTSVVVDEKGTPLGFLLGRDAFISLLEHFDSEFERRAKDERLGFDNPAGQLIDLIEEKLPINPSFTKDLKSAIEHAKRSGWIPLREIKRSLHV